VCARIGTFDVLLLTAPAAGQLHATFSLSLHAILAGFSAGWQSFSHTGSKFSRLSAAIWIRGTALRGTTPVNDADWIRLRYDRFSEWTVWLLCKVLREGGNTCGIRGEEWENVIEDTVSIGVLRTNTDYALKGALREAACINSAPCAADAAASSATTHQQHRSTKST
jgi:hypothetical protein